MAVYDVTVTLHPAMPTWDGEPPPRCELIKQLGVGGEDANVSLLTLGVHSGTHVDAPRYFIPGGAGVDELAVDALVGPCRVVRVDAARLIQSDELARVG